MTTEAMQEHLADTAKVLRGAAITMRDIATEDYGHGTPRWTALQAHALACSSTAARLDRAAAALESAASAGAPS